MPDAGSPTVSVVMTTYNGAPLILQSIDSLLAQTWRDFELIVVDDCSTDDTVVRLRRYVDPRLRIVCNAENLGVVGSRNVGFSFARGRYLATLDHDDISMPDRLARQVGYLDAHPEVVLVGARWFNLSNGVTRLEPNAVTEPFMVRWSLYLSNPMCYSSMMVRTDCLRRLAPPMRQERVLADDFDFYHRVLRFGEIARLPEPLVVYRIHGNNTFQHRRREMQDNAALVLEDAYAEWFGDRSRATAELMTRLVASRGMARNDAELCHLRSCLETLAERFIQANLATQEQADAVRTSVREIWNTALRCRIRAGGISSLRHASMAWKEETRERGALIRAVVVGCIPAKSALRKLAGWLPKGRPAGSASLSDAPGHFVSSAQWDRVATQIVAVLCLPLLAVLWARSLRRWIAGRRQVI